MFLIRSSLRVATDIVLLSLLVGNIGAIEEENIDVIQGDKVTLKCRFAPVSSDADVTLYWIRTNSHGSDNAAIQQTPLDSQYSVYILPRSGTYDLVISNTSYTRDNASFKCMMKEAGTGKLLHTSKVSLTVLVRPGAPTISPRTPVATEGQSLNLTCSSVGGSPAPDIFWYREGDSNPLHGHVTTQGRLTTSSLEIVPEKDDDGVSYRCTVWNRAMGRRQRLDTALRLHVKYFPRVRVGPYNPLKVEEGDTAAMLCEVDSNPSVSSVRWTRSGRYIATTFRHVIPSLSLSDNGVYTCEADNGLGHVSRAQLNVSVLHGPRVKLERSKDLDAGTDIRLACTVESNPAPSVYVWTKTGDSRFKQKGRELVVANVSHEDSGEYFCSVENILTPTHGVPSTRFGNGSITLNVRHSPGEAVVKSENGMGVEGGEVILTCEVTPPGYPQPQHKWWRSDQTSDILSLTSNLTLANLRLDDEDSYSCQAYNELGKSQVGTGMLRVVQTPRIVTTLPQEIVRRSGETGVSLSCQARGKPAPEVKWMFEGKRLSETGDMFLVNTTTVTNRNDKSVMVWSTLHFRGSGRRVGGEVVARDAGQYSCVFVNIAGQTESEVSLKIEHAPMAETNMSDTRVAGDLLETVTMTCVVTSYPAPTFSWTRGNNVLGSLGRIMSQQDSVISDNLFKSTLTIASVKKANYGDFVCRARNSLGSSVHTIKLVRKSKPDTPTDVLAVKAMSDFVMLRWKENFHGGIPNVTFKVQYRPQDSTILYAKERLCHQNPCKISSLNQHTTYIFRVKAMNRLGESGWSEYAAVTTMIDVKQIPRVSSLKYENITRTLEFQAPSYSLYLVAKIEALWQASNTTSWNIVKTVSLKKKPNEIVLPKSSRKFNNIRVSLCIETDPSLCGQPVEINSIEPREAVPQLSTTLHSENWMVGVVVGVLFTLVASLMLMVKCCWCSSTNRRDKIMAAAEREKQLMMSARPDILHPIDEKMLELANGDTGHCLQHGSVMYPPGGGHDSSHHSDDSVWWIKQQQALHECGCECQYGPGAMTAAQSLPHLSSPQDFRHVAPQYYSQDLVYGTVPRRVIREIVV